MGQPLMKKGVLMMLLAILLLIGGMGANAVAAAGSDGNPVAKFPDKALERAIRQQTGVLRGDLHLKDVQAIKELVMTVDTFNGEIFTEDSTIKDLTGIEQLTNLETLDLRYYHKVSDLQPLAGLTKLHTLLLWSNPVRDIKPLAKLTELRELDLSETQVSDLSPLQGLTQLETLTLTNTPVKDIGVLGALPGLRSLIIYSIEERDSLFLSVLNKLTNLETLEVYRQGADNLDFLSVMPKLKRLVLVGNRIRDFSPISRSTGLEALYLDKSGFGNLDFLKPLTKLRELELDQGEVKNLQPLAELTSLEKLMLTQNEISDLRPLAALLNLKELNLDYNAVKDISPLASLKGLTKLMIGFNAVSDVSPLAGLVNLETLDLQSNNVASLRGLENLSRLKELNVLRNAVPVDGEPEIAALRDRITAAGGKFDYEEYKPFPDILLYLYDGKVYANGSYARLDVSATVVQGRTLVPIRFVSEQLGAEVTWNQDDKTILVEGANMRVMLTSGKKDAEVNGKPVQMDALPVNSNGTVLVPLRFLSERLDLQVDYYPYYASVALTKKSASGDAVE